MVTSETLNSFLKSYLSVIPEISLNFSKCLKICQCSILGFALLPCILTSTFLFIICRKIISFYYKLWAAKYSLVSPQDSSFSAEKQANRISINTFVYVKGQPNLQELRNRLEAVLDSTEYFKFKHRLVKKFGFYTWERQENFDISQHVKYFPGLNLLETYKEQEVLENVETLLDNEFNPTLPQWEFLVFPKVAVDQSQSGNDGNNDSYAFVFRVYHCYMDGISLIQMLKRIIDENHNGNRLAINPVNLSGKIRSPNALERVIHCLQVIILGPYTIYKTTRVQKLNTFQYMTKNKGPKLLGCTKNGIITLSNIKLIRKSLGCSTTAIFNSAITAALRKSAIRKGLEIPDEVDFGFTVAILPYPDDSPQNRFTIGVMRSPVGKPDSLERLDFLDNSMKSLAPHEISTLYWLGMIIGYYPYPVIEKIFENMHSGYVVTNLPGFSGEITLLGESVSNMYGCPPIKNGIGFGIGVSSYMGRFQACWIVEKSKVIETKEDMQRLIEDFEREIKMIENTARKKLNNN